jgi:O-antigen/teichoic acid export membrane protein
MPSLKHKAISGVAWSSLERFSAQGIQFVILIVMARALLPEDYGVVAMLAIFLAVFQIVIDGGFFAALIQKSDRSDVDYSTAFYFNIGISVLLFLALFFSAPTIAKFYNTPVLASVTKIIALNLVINAFGIVPRAKLTVRIDFKTQTKASLTGVIISGTVGIWMAYSGYGVWALVYQSLLNNGINTLLLWILAKWCPMWAFSGISFKRLFSFGSKLLVSALLATGFRNLYTLVIGKKFTAQNLGYYSRADQFAQFPSINFMNIIERVAFPVMCEAQHNDEQLRNIFYKFLRISTFIIFPLMIGMAALSEPFIRLFLTEKWMGTVVLLQLLCFVYIWHPINALNLLLLQVKGRSDLLLRLVVINVVLGIIVLFVTLPFGLITICTGLIVHAVLCLYINAYYTKKYVGISLFQQLKDVLPSLLLSVSMGGLIFLLTQLNLSDAIILSLGVGIGCLYYFGVASIFRMKEWQELRAIPALYLKKQST